MNVVFVFVVALFATQAVAFPTKGAPGRNQKTQNYNFNGIAKLSNCSGSLFRFEGQSEDSNALILTNGHCVKLMGENEAIVHQSSFRAFKIFDSENQFASESFPAEELSYAVMKDTDMGVYKLRTTYADLKSKFNIDALVLSEEPGHLGEDIAMVSGYFKSVSQCQLEAFVHELREGKWTFTDSLRYSEECEVIHGTSGSPVVSLGTGKIIGVNNTVFEDGEACSINNPCEVSETGEITTLSNRGYGQQTYKLYSCLNSDFEIDTSLESCELPKPRTTQSLFQVGFYPTAHLF